MIKFWLKIDPHEQQISMNKQNILNFKLKLDILSVYKWKRDEKTQKKKQENINFYFTRFSSPLYNIVICIYVRCSIPRKWSNGKKKKFNGKSEGWLNFCF